MKRLCLCLSLCLLALFGCAKQEQVSLTISAAASLQNALTDIQKQYETDHPNMKLSFNFGSSGALQQQIEQGAPVDVFFSAAEDKFQALQKKGLVSEGKNVLGNKLVLVAPKNSALKGFSDLVSAKQVSMGAPESVPAGKYAKQSLTKLGLWQAVESKMIYAKDVRQVLTYVETGNVEAGIVYETDAKVSDKVKIVATADAGTHDPIVYPLGVLKATKHKAEADDFYKYLQSDAALKIFQKYGFTVL
ncbi:molybdate ABC transporter substrate-binding protein [Ectobacillus ponti]|uniref:molybdate ABC transporter substrate-binding protein n=1 Tax=Ectobacillus ponti TaxID=2961894 RepID=UPI003F6734C6